MKRSVISTLAAGLLLASTSAFAQVAGIAAVPSGFSVGSALNAAPQLGALSGVTLPALASPSVGAVTFRGITVLPNGSIIVPSVMPHGHTVSEPTLLPKVCPSAEGCMR